MGINAYFHQIWPKTPILEMEVLLTGKIMRKLWGLANVHIKIMPKPAGYANKSDLYRI